MFNLEKIINNIRDFDDNFGIAREHIETKSLSDFVNNNSQVIYSELQKALNTSFSGLENPEKYRRIAEVLKSLDIVPYPRQARLIAAAIEHFSREKNLLISSEMGTGKTLMSISIVFTYMYLHRKSGNIALLCPNHLKKKWEDEINKIFGKSFRNIEVIQVKNGAEILKFKGKENKNTIRFFIFSKETAKLGYLLSEPMPPKVDITAFSAEDKTPISCKCRYCGTAYSFEELEKNRLKIKSRVFDKICKHLKTTPIENFKAENLTCQKCLLQENAKKSNYSFKHSLQNKGFLKTSSARKVSFARAVKQLPKGFFEFFIADEVHQMKGDTGIGEAFARISIHSKRTIGLTGTLLNGYASSLFYILYRLFPHLMKKHIKIDYKNGVSKFVDRFGGYEYAMKKAEKDETAKGKIVKKSENLIKASERAVINPIMIKILLGYILFLRIDEMNIPLPDYSENIITVPLESEISRPYGNFIGEMLDAIIIGKSSLLGAFCNYGLSIPDNPSKMVEYCCKDGETFYYYPIVDENYITNKEKELIKITKEELSQSRKVLIYCTFVENLGRLESILSKDENFSGQTIKVLSSDVPSENREEWIKKNPCDVLITNPKLVETGLDLLEYPTIIFYQTGYETSVLKQASRRSWRIGQKNECKVYFLTYADTAQHKSIRLMSKKIKAANDLEGRLSTAEDLASLEEENNLQKALVEALLKKDSVESGDDVSKWTFTPRELDNFERFFQDEVKKISLDYEFLMKKEKDDDKKADENIQEISLVRTTHKEEIYTEMESLFKDESMKYVRTIEVMDRKTKNTYAQLVFDF